MKSLIKQFDNRKDAIITNCFIVMPSDVVDKNGDRRYCRIENAVWDTGATNTVISPEIVEALGLKPTGKSSISAYGGIVETCTYKIDLCFDNGYRIQNLEVMSGDYSDYDVLIGKDVITQGDFCVSTVNGKTSFCFRMPSKGFILTEED